jgi:serine/threonine-protein kinase
VQAAVDGVPDAGFGTAMPRARAVSAPPAGSMVAESAPVPDPPTPAGPGRNAGPAAARNSRFGAASRPAAGASAAASGMAVPAQPDNAGRIRAAHGPDARASAEPRRDAGGGGAKPPSSIRPAAPGKSGPPVRRILAGAGLAAVFVGAVYAWSLSIGHDSTAKGAGLSVVAPEGNCVVSYAVWSDDGGRFKAQLTVANRDATPIPAWKLWFLMNGDQVVSGKVNQGENVPVNYSDVKLTQAGKEVTITSAGALSSAKTETMRIDGSYQQSNAAPMVFKLDGKTCETFVSGKPGEPSQQVEHLSNGSTRLAPAPTSKTPVPGITIGDNGIALVKPTTKPTAGPPGTSTGPGAGPTHDPTTDPTETTEASQAPSLPPVETASSEPVVEPTTTRPSPPPPLPTDALGDPTDQ